MANATETQAWGLDPDLSQNGYGSRRRSRNGQWKNQSSIMLEDHEESIIDPEHKEFKETIWNARKKLETPMAPAMPCKTSKKSKHGETRSKTNDFKSKFACILEASESTRLRMEESLPKYHEGPYCRKRRQFTTALQFGTQIYSYASSNEDTSCKSSSGKRTNESQK